MGPRTGRFGRTAAFEPIWPAGWISCASARRLGPHPRPRLGLCEYAQKAHGDSLDAALHQVAAALQLVQRKALRIRLVHRVLCRRRRAPRTRPASTCMLPATLPASTASASIAHLDTIPAPALSTTASCLSLFYYLSHRFGASL